MIEKEVIGNELYVYITRYGYKRSLLYKRWINRGYGMVMDRIPFTANDIDMQKIKSNVGDK